MIIDMHAHIYPDKIALKASESIEHFYDIHVGYDGRVSTLLQLGRESGVDRFLVHSVATMPGQVGHINDFIINAVKENPQNFVGFAALHPDYSDIPGEVDRIIKAGLKGIKLHPDFQKFNIDDERVFPLYECIEGRIPVLFHTGDKRYGFSKPRRVLNIMKRFPRLEIIGAHFAGYSEWDDAAEILGGSGVYVDTSSSMFWLTPEHTRRLIDAYGADRVMFASDYPMWSPKDELERLAKVDLTQEERELILHGNAERLFGL